MPDGLGLWSCLLVLTIAWSGVVSAVIGRTSWWPRVPASSWRSWCAGVLAWSWPIPLGVSVAVGDIGWLQWILAPVSASLTAATVLSAWEFRRRRAYYGQT